MNYHRKRLYRKFVASAKHLLFSRTFLGVCLLLMVILYGTLGVYDLRHQFTHIKSYTDAFYYTVVTYSILGDSNVIPLTNDAKYFVVTMVVLGLSSVATFGSIIVYQITTSLQEMEKKLHGGRVLMKDHIIIFGYSVLAEILIHKLSRDNVPFILLDNIQRPEFTPTTTSRFMYFTAPSRVENLVQANIEQCRMIIATTESDSENILMVLNAHKLKQELNSDFTIVARILYEENIDLARQNGADNVISPTLMAAQAIMTLF